ncbi:MAG TPA: alcohol dehydrogenase catalytic domain-containing protein [Rhizobium sp.]|nr:alcohol dehydrogenase catalytic domain-containing protein [Rhizobium sp.]
MAEALRVICLQPSSPAMLKLVPAAVPPLQQGKVLVRVSVSSVNPIDVKRAAGYGARLLSLKGAGRFPLVLGNDFVGVVEAVGEGVEGWRAGDKVLGLLPTGKNGGAHRSHVLADPRLLVPAIRGMGDAEQAIIPYCFTTAWLAVAAAGLTAENASGKRVLVHGASGGVGTIAVQMLSHWGATVTAICSTQSIEHCRAAGAAEVIDRTIERLETLEPAFDAVLNFASREDEGDLLGRLANNALGYATTVHPLLANADRLGLLRGAARSCAEFNGGRRQARTHGARYGWTVFKPVPQAMKVMAGLMERGVLRLPLGVVAPAGAASRAFEHIMTRKAGRAAILFETVPA